MTKPIGVQLYSVREALARDFESVIRRIAAFGYQGVEPYRFANTTPQAAGDLFKALGLQVPSAHSPLPVGESRAEALETMRIYGCKYLVVPSMPRPEFTTVEGVLGVCNQLNEANKVVRDAGLTLLYHNHEFEFQPLDGTYPYRILIENLDPSIGFQIDTYWAQVGGGDPVALINELGARVPLLHIKDGPADPADRNAPMTAVGEGKMDIAPILEAGKSAEWFIVEIDRCATDMMEAIGKSYPNLEKLVRGH